MQHITRECVFFSLWDENVICFSHHLFTISYTFFFDMPYRLSGLGKTHLDKKK